MGRYLEEPIENVGYTNKIVIFYFLIRANIILAVNRVVKLGDSGWSTVIQSSKLQLHSLPSRHYFRVFTLLIYRGARS